MKVQMTVQETKSPHWLRLTAVNGDSPIASPLVKNDGFLKPGDKVLVTVEIDNG
jgi:hypothetical protein